MPRLLAASLFCLLACLTVCPSADADDRPNIVVILVDDMGFSDLGCYGSEIETPNIDSLAQGGLRFTQFHNAGRCCPTRASLLTGLHPHQVGIGHMTAPPGQPLGFEGPYQGYLNDNCATLAEVLRGAGYHTLMTGKWHVGVDPAQQEAWPLQRGFDKYYGCLSGAINYFKPGGGRGITSGNELVPTDDEWYATDAFTDKAMEFISEAAEADDRPFFLYLAYNAPHWPLNAKESDYQKYRGKYEGGWGPMMAARQAKQRELGLFAGDVTPAEHLGPEWDSLKPQQRNRLDAVMAAYAGCLDSVDQNVGKLMEHLDQIGKRDNTLILFLSDNGACQEGGRLGNGGHKMVMNPPLRTTNGVQIGLAWANACNTPFRKYKHFVHEGGACTPLIANWPAGIAEGERGGFVRQVGYLPDFMATCVDLAAADYPQDVPPCEGESLAPLLRGNDAPIHTEPIFWEHEGNAAVRWGKWKLVCEYQKPWELYNIDADRTELNDLASAEPGKRDEMVAKWEAWARKTGVAFPERFNMYRFLQEKAAQEKQARETQQAS
ncbi:Arylsulfatase [Posidoniimonas polymericola]|uniref:Arylsulfatase n=1 Tax=Posidoniimonas polymericola TaxID=2528002 RepID=A0A5C5ZFJ2_9BACT|nr:arylsulfatase [Posidoniimonas polymericola]TWT85870.1 Arylsulfatase [Posidoniimonas polymericola]